MKKYVIIIYVLFLILSNTYSQFKKDSIDNIINNAKGKEKVDLYIKYAGELLYDQAEISIEYTEKALKQAQKINYKKGEIEAYINYGEYFSQQYNDSLALESYLNAYGISAGINFKEGITKSLTGISICYYYLNDLKNAFEKASEALKYAKEIKEKREEGKLLQIIGNIYKRQNDLENALKYYQASLKIRQEVGDAKDIAKSFNQIGLIHFENGNFEKAIENYKSATELREQAGDIYGKGIDLYNIGNAYKELEKYEDAIQYYQMAMDNFVKTNNEVGIANCYNSLGIINDFLGNYNKAITNYQQALQIFQKFNNKISESDALDNMATVMTIQISTEFSLKYGENWDDSLEYHRNNMLLSKFDSISDLYHQALDIRKALNDSLKIAKTFNNIGTINTYKGTYMEAIKDYYKALEISTNLKDTSEMLINIYGVARTYNRMKRPDDALNILIKNLPLAINLNQNDILFEYYEDISKAYRLKKDYKNAIHYYMLYTETKEKFLNEERLRQTAELETKYQTKQKEDQLRIKDQELQISETTIKKRNQVIIFFVIFLILILGSAVMLLRLNRKIQKANIELEHKNEVITHQKEEITDSIKYARRIQRAVLPSDEVADSILPEHFILFRPRDIVSGDFYWLGKKKNKIIVVAADCTGHGVPGAFMSMLGVSFLNEIINKEEVVQANLILNELRENVKTTLSQTGAEGEAKDGMDIALVIMDLENNKIQYAGAYNPLYLVRNKELIETKADKMPIGIYVKENESFTNNDIQIQKGDTFYIFSDGFVDQFGGPDRRKFMSKPFKRLLEDIQGLPMAEQREILNNTIDEWRGDTPQVDDMIVIGVRVG